MQGFTYGFCFGLFANNEGRGCHFVRGEKDNYCIVLYTYGLLGELETFIVRVKSVIQQDFIFETMERMVHT